MAAPTNFYNLLLRKFLLYFLCSITYLIAFAQPPSFNFRHLTTSNGLSDGTVHAITQDKYGFIWIATSYGLNRFDGISVKTYFSKQKDSTSLSNNYVLSLFCDKKGNLWAGTNSGLCKYNYATNNFSAYPSQLTTAVYDIREDSKENIWLATDRGLWITDTKQKIIKRFLLNNDTAFQRIFSVPMRQFTASADGNWYIASLKGVKIFNPLSRYYGELNYKISGTTVRSNELVLSAAADASGSLWEVCLEPQPFLKKINLSTGITISYDYFFKKEKSWAANAVQRVFADNKNRIWITSAFSGLTLFNQKEQSFTDYKNNPFVPNSLVSNQSSCIYQDNNSTIWIGTSGYGLSYFSPDKNLFYSILLSFDKNHSLLDSWSRSACEDKEGNLWLATAIGLSKYNRQTGKYEVFANENGKKNLFYTNSIRSLLYDDNNDLWVGTAKGLNRLHPLTGKTDFFDEKQGIAPSFFWMMTKDKQGEVWAGAASGLYHYIRKENRFDDLSKDSLLSPYAHKNVQALFTDSHNRLWIGLLNTGVIMYDIDRKKIEKLSIEDSLVFDTRFSSFAEDKNGIIWIGAEEGLTAYDPQQHKSKFYFKENGLPSGRTNNLMVDQYNRLWIGTSNGLCVFDSSRSNLKRFDVNDGLLTNQFNEQASFCTHDNLFVFPTYKGFLLFRGEDYKENQQPTPAYLTAFKVNGKEITNILNPEELKSLSLKYNENYFSIDLCGLNYMNPYQCTYAYKLEPFDKDWIFTTSRELNYTNVPSGNYTFHYKVVTNTKYDAAEKIINIFIAAVFYKTWWFRLLVLLFVGGLLFLFFRYRLQHREKLLLLHNKAQLLEKEKTVVQFENLKQHLNPHFLFNSLTSLRSLIKTDPKTAAVFLDDMSKVYRYVLKSSEQELVRLQDELEFVKTFIELQQIRFKNGLVVNIKVAEDCYNKYIVPVTLQNLVENAIKHNTADTESPLVIDIYTENNFVFVQNNLQRYRIVETSNKKGLESLRTLY
ncbi:MAG: two-component regulator propeller domain-containing protein, partial [Sphingobacteriales bacterium]